MPRESTCYAPTRTVLKIGRTRDEISSADSVLLNDFRAACNLHFLMYTSDFTTLGKNSAIKIVSLLVEKNTVFDEYLPSRIFKFHVTLFIHTHKHGK